MGKFEADHVPPVEFREDSSVPAWLTSWESLTPKEDLDPEAEYFCLHTWISVPMSQFSLFNDYSKRLFDQMREASQGKVIGFTKSLQAKSFFLFRPTFETVSVWHNREDLVSFYSLPLHLEAMDSFGRVKNKNRTKFGTRRVWLRAKDLPTNGDMGQTRNLVKLLKTNTFRAAARTEGYGDKNKAEEKPAEQPVEEEAGSGVEEANRA